MSEYIPSSDHVQTGTLRVEILPGKFLFRLLEPINIAGYTVPAGYITDFLSIPRPLWGIFAPISRGCIPSLLHDYLISEKLVTRVVADHIFFNLLKEYNFPKWKARLFWLGVRSYAVLTCKV
jgi:hypothetical protein